MLSRTARPTATAKRDAPGSLTTEERRHLLAWVEAARAHGIDAAEDLRMRPWPEPVSADVIGVFRIGEDLAAWLVVGQQGVWTVVDVADGRVLTTQPALAAALASICPPQVAASAVGSGVG